MIERVIEITGFDIASSKDFKMEIMRRLKIKGEEEPIYILEFNNHISTYLYRKSNTLLHVKINLRHVQLAVQSRVQRELNIEIRYPQGFEFGQPNMATSGEPDWRTEEEIERISKKSKPIMTDIKNSVEDMSALSSRIRVSII